MFDLSEIVMLSLKCGEDELMITCQRWGSRMGTHGAQQLLVLLKLLRDTPLAHQALEGGNTDRNALVNEAKQFFKIVAFWGWKRRS